MPRPSPPSPAPAWSRSPTWCPSAPCQFAGSHGCAAEPGLDALLARDDIDVVSVCVPSGLHAEVGIQAAAAGKHLVVEKPIDVSLAAADRLIDAADAAGVAMTVISQHRFDPGLVELRGLIDDGVLGRLVLGEASTKWYRSQGYYDSGPWRGTWALDGGSLMNQGIHYVDLLRWIMGPVTEVSAVCATQGHQIEVEDTALAVLRFSSGAVGTIVSSTAVFPGFAQRLEVSGTGGTVVVEDGEIVYRALDLGFPRTKPARDSAFPAGCRARRGRERGGARRGQPCGADRRPADGGRRRAVSRWSPGAAAAMRSRSSAPSTSRRARAGPWCCQPRRRPTRRGRACGDDVHPQRVRRRDLA